MPYDGQNNSNVSKIIAALGDLTKEFARSAQAKEIAAAQDRRAVDTLQAAATALLASEEKNSQLQTQIRELTKNSFSKKMKGEKITFFVDASGSACSGRPSLLKQSLQDIALFAQTTRVKASTVLWGDSQPVVLSDGEDLKKFENGLNCGTDLTPAIYHMQRTAFTAKKPQHFVILSDGDIFDKDKALTEIDFLLKTSSVNVAVDFVIADAKASQSQMANVATQLQKLFPGKVGVHLLEQTVSPYSTLTEITRQKHAKPKKKSSAAPKP